MTFYHREAQAIRKMQPGTMGGQSRAATPVDPAGLQQASVIATPSSTPPVPQTACPLYIGSTNYTSQAIGVSDNGTIFHFWDPEGDPAHVRAVPPSTPEGDFIELSRHDIDPGYARSNFAVDEQGTIYYWSIVSETEFGIVKQQLDTITPIMSLPSGYDFWFGPAYNPYDQMLYDATGNFTGPGTLQLLQIDPVTGDTATFPVSGVDNFGDMVSFTPDGAVWMLADTPGPGFGRVARYDLTTDNFEIFTSLDLDDSTGTPVPLYGTPDASIGDVLVAPNDDDPLKRVTSTGATVNFSCDMTTPLGPWQVGTARTASAIFSGSWMTSFIWPSVFGAGSQIWTIGPMPL